MMPLQARCVVRGDNADRSDPTFEWHYACDRDLTDHLGLHGLHGVTLLGSDAHVASCVSTGTRLSQPSSVSFC